MGTFCLLLSLSSVCSWKTCICWQCPSRVKDCQLFCCILTPDREAFRPLRRRGDSLMVRRVVWVSGVPQTIRYRGLLCLRQVTYSTPRCFSAVFLEHKIHRNGTWTVVICRFHRPASLESGPPSTIPCNVCILSRLMSERCLLSSFTGSQGRAINCSSRI